MTSGCAIPRSPRPRPRGRGGPPHDRASASRAKRSGADAYASPRRAEKLVGLPPATVITAEYDPLRDEGEAYAARLRDAGVETVATRYGGQIYGFVSLVEVFDQGKAGVAQIAAALRAALVWAVVRRSTPADWPTSEYESDV